MVEILYNNGVNFIWEYFLLDFVFIMSGRCKVNLQDKVYFNKVEFIRVKYQMLVFVYCLFCWDDDSVIVKDFSK